MKIGSLKVAFTYAGCIVGAGFLSGQELWQFFGSYGNLGVLGFVLAIVIQAVLGTIVINYARLSKRYEFDNLIVRNNNRNHGNPLSLHKYLLSAYEVHSLFPKEHTSKSHPTMELGSKCRIS